MSRILRKLEDAQLVKEIGGDWAGLVPGCDPDRITVEEVMLQMEGMQHALPDIGGDDRERAAIGDLFNRLAESTKATLKGLTIGQLVRDFYTPRAAPRIEDRFTGR